MSFGVYVYHVTNDLFSRSKALVVCVCVCKRVSVVVVSFDNKTKKKDATITTYMH